MTRNWTFGRKLGAGFGVMIGLAIAIGLVGVVALRSVVRNKDRVISINGNLLLDAEKLQSAVNKKSAALRGYLLGADDRFLDEMREARQDFMSAAERLNGAVYTEEGRRQLEGVRGAEADHQSASDVVIAMRRGGATGEAAARAFADQIMPKRVVLEKQLHDFEESADALRERARVAASDAASRATGLVILLVLGVAVSGAIFGVFLTRGLARQVGGAVGQVQSSSAELQAVANQQAVGAKEQSTAMNEIATTVRELLATSRQIAESSQRVVQIAQETGRAASGGESTVEKAHESIVGIRRQVDFSVGHMVDLGKKSQQIGAVVEIVSELAEQTNILAINAMIEAAGAGEAGGRFAVVADEIRKLADRVAGSAKEIRTLIDDIRAAVNTNVMATETGSKAVDAGSRQFGEVASALKRIAALVTTTAEAAREIELSTKQQSSAVEQVNLAISNIAQATRETESSSSQTLQTASQLADLSKGLLRLVQPQEAMAA
jgi:CHASE3 domain sensor protein